MEPLGGCKPSELMAAMEQLRPPSDRHFFVYHILQRLPREVRIQLADEDPTNTRRLAEKANQLMALHQPQVHAIAAAAPAGPADSSEVTIAAAVAGKPGQGQQKKKWRKLIDC
jgi:hypothetical protein